MKIRIQILIHISNKVKSWIRIRINLQRTAQNVWNMSLFEHFSRVWAFICKLGSRSAFGWKVRYGSASALNKNPHPDPHQVKIRIRIRIRIPIRVITVSEGKIRTDFITMYICIQCMPHTIFNKHHFKIMRLKIQFFYKQIRSLIVCKLF